MNKQDPVDNEPTPAKPNDIREAILAFLRLLARDVAHGLVKREDKKGG